MRVTIITIFSSIFLVFSLLGIYTVSNQMIRKNELTTNTVSALVQTMSNLKDRKIYKVKEQDQGEELVADFIQRLLYLANSDSTLKVNILEVDAIKGLLDVEVVSTYQTLFNEKKSISCRRTIIYDEEKEEGVI